MRKAILIGASGFIGRHLLNELNQSGFQIVAIENKRKLPQLPNLKIVTGGIKSVSTQLIDEVNPEFVFHCARPTMSRVRRLGRSISAQIAAYYNGKLIKSLKNSKSHPLLVFASGSLMYGNGDKPFFENAPLNPISYARQYHVGEKPLINEVLRSGYPVMMLRFPWLLGNGSWFKWFYLDQIRKNNVIPIFGDGTNKMHVIDINDAVSLMIRYSLEKNKPGIFNLYGNEPFTQINFAVAVTGIFNVKKKIYSEIFPNIEIEALEAFTSNIELNTHFPDIIKSSRFTPLDKKLTQIKKDFLDD